MLSAYATMRQRSERHRGEIFSNSCPQVHQGKNEHYFGWSVGLVAQTIEADPVARSRHSLADRRLTRSPLTNDQLLRQATKRLQAKEHRIQHLEERVC